MDGTQVSVLEETHEVSLRRLLQGHDSRRLESEVRLEVLGNLPHQALERQLADEELCGLLILADLAEGHSAGAVSVGLLHSSGGRGGLAGSLGSQLLPWCLPSGGLAGSLLGTSHDEDQWVNGRGLATRVFR